MFDDFFEFGTNSDTERCLNKEVRLHTTMCIKHERRRAMALANAGMGTKRSRLKKAINKLKVYFGGDDVDEPSDTAMTTNCYIPPADDEFIPGTYEAHWFAQQDEPEEDLIIDLDEAEEYLNTTFSVA